MESIYFTNVRINLSHRPLDRTVSVYVDNVEWIVPRCLTARELEDFVVGFNKKIRAEDEQDCARPRRYEVLMGSDTSFDFDDCVYDSSD